MNIAIVFSWCIFNKHGGTERVLAEFCNAMVSKGHSITVYSPDCKEGSFLFSIDSSVKFSCYGEKNEGFFESERGIKFRTFLILRKDIRKERRHYLRRKKIESSLRKKLKTEDVDIFITFSAYATYLLKMAIGDKVRIPIVTMIHTFIESSVEEMFPYEKNIFNKSTALNSRFRKDLQSFKETVRDSTLIQVLRPEYIDQIREFFQTDRVICIPNAVPQFNEISESNHKTIIHVGRLCDVKRQHMIVQAFSLIRDSYPEWKVELWGDYTDVNYKNYVEGIINELQLQNNIKLCGPTDFVKDKLMNASIFAFPSKFEGFPLALTEAMSLGLSVVGFSNCPSVNTIIRDNINGLLCDDNVEDLARVLSCLMSDEDFRRMLGAQAKRDMEIYSPNIVWGQWEEVLLRICLLLKIN